MTTISADTLRLALDAIKAKVEPLQIRDTELLNEWSRAAGFVPGAQANRSKAVAARTARLAVQAELDGLNRARLEIEAALIA